MLGFNPDQQLKKRALKKKGVGSDQQNSAPNLNAENPAIAGGGMIQGPGTGTSDDIQTQMPAGSYIMPADSTDQIGEEGLAGLGSPANVRVSNGEYQLPPEQVHAVGVQALDQMKEQTSQQGARGFNPQINRDGEQFFNQGGQVLDEEEAKRRAARTPGLAPAGIALTPDMANANRVAQQRQGGAQAIEQTKQNIGNKLDAAGNVIGQAYKGITNAATVVPRTAYGVATGEIPVKFNSEARHPGADIVDGYKARDAKENASKWVNDNPEQAKAAGLGMQGIADRATKPLIASMSSPQPALPQQRPLQDIGGAPMLLPQQSPTQTQQAEIDPATGQATAPQPVADQGAVTQLSNDLANTGKPDPVTGFVERTDQERRDFARSNKVDGVPMLDSRMAKTIDPKSINTMSSKGMMGLLGSQSSEAVSQALKAAADRGDWDAVNRHYQSQGQGFAGMGAPGQGQGPRVTVVRDPTRTPSNAEIIQQRLESARLRNADAGRRTDIEGQRVAAGIGNDQFRNQIQSREVDIAGRNQDLAERQAEPTIAQQQRLQSLYAEYDAADDAGKARIAQQINQLSGKNESLKDNFLTAGGGQEWDSQGGLMRNVPQRVIDLRTGQEIGGNSQVNQQQTSSRPVGTKSTVNGKTAVWDGNKWIPQ